MELSNIAKQSFFFFFKKTLLEQKDTLIINEFETWDNYEN